MPRRRRRAVPFVLALSIVALTAIHILYLNFTVLQTERIVHVEDIIFGQNGPPELVSSSLLLVEEQRAQQDGNGGETTGSDSSNLRSSVYIDSNSSSPSGTSTIMNLQQQILPAPHPPRIVLGILCDPGAGLLEARHILRTTYLSFDRVHQTRTPSRVCSLLKFSTKPSGDWGPFECQMVYAFIAGGNATRTETNTPPSQWQDLGTVDTNILIPATNGLQKMINRDFLDPNMSDWVVLNVDESHSSFKLWAWHQYMFHHWNGTFDYIAHTDWRLLLQPIEFWQNEIFSPSRNIHSRAYAQFPKDNKSEEQFGLLSKDLHELLVQADPVVTYGTLTTNGLSLDNLVAGLKTNTTSLVLKGIIPTGGKSFLDKWDAYKDNLNSTIFGGNRHNERKAIALVEGSNAIKYFKDQTRKFLGPRILMGIFTMDSGKEKERRAAVRSTYLSYYNDSTTPYRICSLFDLLKGSLPNNGADCQMAYTFVMGSNPNGPTELMEPNSTFPLTIDTGSKTAALPSLDALKDEDDILHLNIRENMEEGKSPTWFKYAAMVIDEQIYFDYVGKTDTDTLIYPNKLLDGVLLEKFPPFPRNTLIYGGRATKIGNPNLIKKMLGPAYFSGELYWMSSDLARFVSSSECDRGAGDFGIEDHAMGNFVHSYPGPIRRVPFKRGTVHRHPFKEVAQYRQIWTSFLN